MIDACLVTPSIAVGRRLLIIGAGGHGKVTADAAKLMGWNEIVFVDDRWPELNSHFGFPVLGNIDSIIGGLIDFDGVVVAIGNNSIRNQLTKKLLAYKFPVVTIIHPTAVVCSTVSIGDGSVICANVVINADAKLGVAVICNTTSVIEHDCCLASGVHLSPGALLAGGVSVGSQVWIGMGASVIQGVSIGEGAVIGAGSVVLSSVIDNGVFAGVPAKSIV